MPALQLPKHLKHQLPFPGWHNDEPLSATRAISHLRHKKNMVHSLILRCTQVTLAGSKKCAAFSHKKVRKSSLMPRGANRLPKKIGTQKVYHQLNVLPPSLKAGRFEPEANNDWRSMFNIPVPTLKSVPLRKRHAVQQSVKACRFEAEAK